MWQFTVMHNYGESYLVLDFSISLERVLVCKSRYYTFFGPEPSLGTNTIQFLHIPPNLPTVISSSAFVLI